MQIGRFFRWWGSELSALLPQSMRDASRRRFDTLRFNVSSPAILVSHQAEGESRELGRLQRGADRSGDGDSERQAVASLIDALKARKMEVVVVLDNELTLVREVSLPLAAEENLHQVISFEMGRQTPFRADDVYFNYQILERDVRAERFRIRLSVAQRKLVDEALTLVGSWQLEPLKAAVDPRHDWDGSSLYFRPAAASRSSATGLNFALGAGALALLVAVVALPLVQQHTKLKSLRSELAQAKKEAATASALQERVDRLIDQEQYVATLKQQTPAVVEMLNELTALLPDATWLHRLEVKKGQVHLQGTSDGASSLIARIEESDAFRNVRFGSPVTQDPTSGGERFQVRADIVKRNIGEEG